MGSSVVKIDIDFGEVSRMVDGIIANQHRGEEVMAVLSQNMHIAVMERFDKAPGWAALSAETIERRRSSRRPRILKDSGILYNSITPDYTFSGSLTGNDDAVAEVFTNVDYAGFHITGTRNMPMRNFFDININKLVDETIDEILDVMCELHRGTP